MGRKSNHRNIIRLDYEAERKVSRSARQTLVFLGLLFVLIGLVLWYTNGPEYRTVLVPACLLIVLGVGYKHTSCPDVDIQPTRSRIIGQWLGFLGSLILFVGLVLSYTHGSEFGILMLPGFILFNLGVRLASADAQEVIKDSSEPIVLFLRPFSQDRSSPLLNIFVPRVNSGNSTEESFNDVFHNVGPMVAIGQPGEALVTLGAARLYVEDKDWKRSVVDLMKRARIVIISVSHSNGVKWETQTAIKTLQPRQLLYFFPPCMRMSAANQLYQMFREDVQPYLDISLPESIGRANFLYFDEGWNPLLLGPIERPILWIPYINNIPTTRIHRTLRPFLHTVTVEGTPVESLQLPSRLERSKDILLYVLILIPYCVATMFVAMLVAFGLGELGMLTKDQSGGAAVWLTLLFFFIGAWCTRPWKRW